MMTHRHWYPLAALTLLLACSDGGAARKLGVGQEPDPKDGGSGGIGSGAGQGGGGGIPSSTQPLSLRVEDIDEMTIEVITLACAGDCADVEAVAHGGNPPYAFTWEDGSMDAKRHVCLEASATLSVSATDTAIDADEFHYDSKTVSAELTATVLGCSDGGISDAGTCDGRLPEELTPDIFGTPAYFAGGASLPAGKYRVTYVDGCMKYDASWAWTVQGLPTFRYQLIGEDTTNVLAVLPGTEAPIGVGITGYPNFDDCVAANRALPPLDFDFAGGKLGLWQNDFKPEDNLPGTTNPTWQLSQQEAGCD